MEQISESLKLTGVSIDEWTHRKTAKDGLKVNFTVSAPLPRELAAQLRCDGIYASDTAKIDLLHKLKDTELIVPVPGTEDACASFFPDLLYCFKAKRDEQQFTIEFSAHVSTRAEDLHEIFKGMPERIDIEIRPRQGQLFEGGTRVDVSPEKRLISPEQARDTSAATDAEFGQQALASATAMGGTHQRDTRKRKDRGTVN